jgi:hypothetical protein
MRKYTVWHQTLLENAIKVYLLRSHAAVYCSFRHVSSIWGDQPAVVRILLREVPSLLQGRFKAISWNPA